MSGNGPLVSVLREALARDKKERTRVSIESARREVSTFVQNVHHFLDEYGKLERVPIDRIMVFDEAQRAWDMDQSVRKFQRHFSEPELILRILSQIDGWAVVVALIGGGQEINRGEAGVEEWARSVSKFPEWQVHVSPEMISGHHSLGGSSLFPIDSNTTQVSQHENLHLAIPVRSFRTEKLTEFVEAVLCKEPVSAKRALNQFQHVYPITITRDLDAARRWLTMRKQGSRRTGIVASSGARRIKPYGLDVKNPIDACTWFLNDEYDVRSSSFLEDPATEFAVQGLELDWTCVCWGGDMRHVGASWDFHAFKGNKWQPVNQL